MNPHSAYSLNPATVARSIHSNKGLILKLVKREIIGRYRGSIMGLLWAFFNPLLMLAVYTFVFSVVFNARWSGGSGSKTEFALVLYAGLLVFNLFSECLNRAPSLVLGNVNFVKKVVFPLEILPVISLGSAAFHFLIGLAVWLIFHLVFRGVPPPTLPLLFLAILPIVFVTLGASWLLASLGVFLRDVTQIIGVLTTVLLFMSPIFYPISALPEEYRVIMHLNPLTFVIEQVRDVMVWGKGIDLTRWSIAMLASMALAWLGYTWFQKTRRGFADVL